MTKRFFYHVTPAYNRESVETEGLSVGQEPNYWSESTPVSRKLHFSAGVKDAHKWGEQIELTQGDTTPMSLFKVDLSGMPTESSTTDIGMVEHTTDSSVPPARVSHLYDFIPGNSWSGKKIKRLKG